MYNLIRLGLSCNQKCIFCFNESAVYGIGEKDFKTEEVKKIIKHFAKKSESVAFTGGEPTIRLDLPELISYAISNQIKVIGIQTNAVKLADKDYAKLLVKKGLTYAFISLHSHKEKISDKLTQTPGSFKKTIQGIKNLLDLGIMVRISHVINLKNYKDLTKFVKFIQNLSPKIEIEFSTVLPFPDIEKNKRIVVKLSEMEPYFYDALEYCRKNDIKFVISGCSVPLCYTQNFERYSSEYNTMLDFLNFNKKLTNPLDDLPNDVKSYKEIRGMEFWERNKIKVEKCKNCSFDKLCHGTWINYAKTFGTEELKPVRAEPFVFKVSK